MPWYRGLDGLGWLTRDGAPELHEDGAAGAEHGLGEQRHGDEEEEGRPEGESAS